MVEALVVRSCVVVVVDACVAGGTYNLAAVREVVGNLADASAAGVHYNVAVIADGTCCMCGGASHSWRVRMGC